MSSKKVLPLLLILTLLTRFIGLRWGSGFFFHPDENNMARALSQLSFSNFNPNFFAYGQFPLYLAFFTFFPKSFASAIFALRFWSALFSIFSVFFFYLLSKRLLSPKQQLIFILLLIFSPGLIQLAHFGTTESLLIFVFSVNLYLSFLIYQKPSFKLIFYAALVTGIGLASKVSALIFAGPVFLALLFKKQFLLATCYLLLATFCFVLFSPYNFIDFANFISALKYETAVATGASPVFYTSQFINTVPYLFQLTKIFPYTSGLPVFLLFFLGLKKIKPSPYWLILIISSLVYFAYFGRLYVKWTRFMSPLFFIPPLLATLALSRLQRLWQNLLLIICLIPGFLFLQIYLRPDIRLIASNWIDQNLPPGSAILSEAGNVINLPVSTQNSYDVVNFDFFNLDQDSHLPAKLTNSIAQADYILIPSRRIFKNQTLPRFPHSAQYYQSLFSGRLGFQPLKKFSTNTSLLLNPENAEETWTVFDHPTIRIYEKI